MQDGEFLQTAVKHLPGGLILIDLDGRLRAVNQTAESLLGLSGPIPPGLPMADILSGHPRIVKVLKDACQTLKEANRQELVTPAVDGEKMVLGYGILVLRSGNGKPIGVGMTFQDITRMIPLMDSHRFLDIALKNLPGGLIFVDLQGKVRGINQTALRLLGITEETEPGTPCHKALVAHPQVYKVLLATCENLTAVNRKEIVTQGPDGDPRTLGYGTLILRNPQGQPIGVGMTFQDITRFIPLPLQTEFIRLVDRFFTPFAAVMVLTAVALGYAEKTLQQIALALMGAMVVFNEVTLFMARRHSEWTKPIGYTRLVTNFAANVVLVYLLGSFWGPMWLLFVLTPVATALYADWKKTAATAVLSAGTLLAIYAARDLSGPVGWGMAGVHAAFIVFVSLFLNSIARMVMQIKAAQSSGLRAQERPGVVPQPGAQSSERRSPSEGLRKAA